MNNFSQDWKEWSVLSDPIVGVEYRVCDRMEVLAQFCTWGEERELPVYYWNPGYKGLQQVVRSPIKGQVVLQPTELGGSGDILASLLDSHQDGIFLLEGVLDFDSQSGELSQSRLFQLSNAFYQLRYSSSQRFLVLLGDYMEMPPQLQPLIPVLSKPLPTRSAVRSLVVAAATRHQLLFDEAQITALVRAILGLPLGEIELVLNRYVTRLSDCNRREKGDNIFPTPDSQLPTPKEQSDSPCLPVSNVECDRLVSVLLQHKMDKLRGRGLEFIAEPDVGVAAGLDLLNNEINKLKCLLDPAALQHNLKFPKGWALWGPPGTGKSLSAKLIAGRLGIPLLASDWGALLGSPRPDLALRDLLESVESLSPAILYFDDFDKAFAGWDSDSNGGVIKRIAGKFLTWLQEHQYPVFMVATVNRLNNLPPELIRRFDDIYFVDMPNNGGVYDIFKLHLRKYFPQFQDPDASPFTDDQWRILIRDYNLCTPAEIANACKKAAQLIYYRNKLEGRENEPLKVTLNDLRHQRSLFTPAMVRDEDQIYAIRNNAPYARPASGPDKSRFAPPSVELFS